MRIVVISDAHGKVTPVETAIERSRPDVVIFLGDGLHALSDLPDIYPAIQFYFVKGNCDFDDAKETDMLRFGGKTIFFTHGHLYHVKLTLEELKAAARQKKADIVLFGHTHVSLQLYEDGVYYLNPGSCALPNNGKPSYGFVDIIGNNVVTNIVYL